jgi:hypothetical protein
MKEIPNLHEQVFVSAMLHETNGTASSLLDSFSGWLLGGFGATSALLVSQYDSVSKHIDPQIIHRFLVLFLWALIFGICQKYLAMIIASSSQSSAIGREMGDKAAANSIPLDFEIIFSEMEKSIIQPGRWFVRRSFAKAKNGDLVSGARNFTRLMQLQGFLGLVQAILILVAISKIASAFHA